MVLISIVVHATSLQAPRFVCTVEMHIRKHLCSLKAARAEAAERRCSELAVSEARGRTYALYYTIQY